MLFSPIIVDKGLSVKNRLVMAPMCMYKAGADGKVTNFHINHYIARAMGGVGLIMLEATGVEERGKLTDQCLGIYEDAHIEGLAKIVKAVKENGAKIAIQLAHGGRKSLATVDEVYGPTDVPFSDKYPTPTAMTQSHIDSFVVSYKAAAVRAKLAGFDMVQVHAAHGYLLSSFLSPLTNTRTDEYGGSVENRTRLLRQVIEAVTEGFAGPVCVRVNGSDNAEGGITASDMAEIVNLVKDTGICILDVSSGSVVDIKENHFVGHQVPHAEVIRNSTDMPVMAGGLLTDPKQMNEILRDGKADMIFVGRELLRNPFFALMAAYELGVEVPSPYAARPTGLAFVR